MIHENRFVVNYPIEGVFERLANVPLPESTEQLEIVVEESGPRPPGLGSLWTVKRRRRGSSRFEQFTMEIVRFEPPQLLVFRSVYRKIETVVRYELTAKGKRQTEVLVAESTTAKGFARLFNRTIQKNATLHAPKRAAQTKARIVKELGGR